MCDAQRSDGERRPILLSDKSRKTILTLEQMEERRLIETLEITEQLEEIMKERLIKRKQ